MPNKLMTNEDLAEACEKINTAMLDDMALDRLIAAQSPFELDKAKAIAEHCRWRLERQTQPKEHAQGTSMADYVKSRKIIQKT